MIREKCSKQIPITIRLPVKPEHYQIILQENIIADNDNLIMGIYKFLLRKEKIYIICCNRKNNTLEYTRFAGTQKLAYIKYEEMIKEIEKDLGV